VGATDLGTSLLRRLRKHALGIMHDTKLGPLARGDNYDLILAKDKFVAAIFALIAARLFGKRFVYWLSYPFPEASLLGARDGTARYPILYWIRGICFSVMLYRILLPAADHIFVQSAEMRRNVIAKGASAAKTTAVPMGVRVESFAHLSGRRAALIPAGRALLPLSRRLGQCAAARLHHPRAGGSQKGAAGGEAVSRWQRR
jgi:hypothetical protein